MALICFTLHQRAFCMAAIVLMLFSPNGMFAAAQKESQPVIVDERLIIFTPHELEPVETAVKEFQETYGILVTVVQGGTGELLGQIRKNLDHEYPACDVFWGGGSESIEANADLFQPITGLDTSSIPVLYRGSDDLWIGESPAPVVLIYNTILVGPEQVPTHWASLLDPLWKGKIAYADPTLSGSAYTLLCTMLSAMGGAGNGGWTYIDQLVENLDGRILSSSSDAYSLVAQGEFYIGLTQEKSATTAINNGATIAISYPGEGTSSVPDAVAIVKGTQRYDLALQFIDFILGFENQRVMATLYNRRPVREGLPPPKGLLEMNEIRLVEYDLAWAATNKAAILRAWSKILEHHKR